MTPIDIAVVVPTRGRPHHAQRFMDSLRASTDRCRVYAVVQAEEAEDFAAWLAAGANVLSHVGHRFGPKVNHAYRSTGEPWLFIVGDDVVFRVGWADELIRAATVSGAKVVGANDLCNPRVMRGEHACHMLISRQYIADVGASWDGPGFAWPEAYTHMFGDDEVVTKAKQQSGVFCVARDAIVEHLHPVAGKAQMDDTYALGAGSMHEDREIFARRMKANALVAS